MAAPVVREVLSAVTTDDPLTLTTAATTEAGWWLLAVQQWDWDPADQQTPPAGTAPAGAWALVADTGPADDDHTHVKAWLRQVTTPGAQQVVFTVGSETDDNHARLWVLSGLRTTTPVIAAAVSNTTSTATLAAPSVDNPDGTALLIAAWIATSESGNSTNLPAGLTAETRHDARYSTSVAAHQTLAAAGPTGDLAVVLGTPSAMWAAVTLLVRGTEPVPLPAPAGLGPPSRWARALTTSRDTTPADTAGQQAATFQFELVDAVTGRDLGVVHPLRDPVPVLTHDTSRTIKRQLDLRFAHADTARIDPVAHRVAVAMRDATGRVWPLGRYLIVDHTLARTSAGALAACALVDEMFLVDQPLTESFSPVTASGGFATSIAIDQAIALLLHDLPIRARVEPSGHATAGTWPAGTSRAKVLADLALDGGYATPWFDHHGDLRLVQAVDPAQRVPDVDLDTPPRVFVDSIAEVTDLLAAPNRFVVVSNDPTAVPVVGSYDLPPSAPHSIQRRGFVVAQVQERQLTNSRQADMVARTIAQAATVAERAELSTPPDPRHDGHTVVWWRGQRWVETSWSMPLQAGAEMRHVLRRSYP